MLLLFAISAGSQGSGSCPSFTLKNETFAGYASGCQNNVALFNPGIDFQECVNVSNIMQDSLSTKSGLANVKIGIVNITSQCSNYCLFKVPDDVTGYLNDTGLNFTNANCGDISIAGLGSAAFYLALNTVATLCCPASLIFEKKLCFGLNLCVPSPAPGPQPPSTSAPTSPTASCIASNQKAIVMSRGSKLISDLEVGEKVLTDEGFQDYMGNINKDCVHKSCTLPTLTIHTVDNIHVELTHGHLIKTSNGFMNADKVTVDSILITRYSKSKVASITNGTSHVLSPFTRSGTIVVNDAVLSCHATDHSHYLANLVYLPVRTGMVNVNVYYKILVNLYNKLPLWAKLYIKPRLIFD
jgi:Hint module